MVDFNERQVELKWVKPRKENGAPVKSYIVEARMKSDNSWITVKETPDTKVNIPWKEGETYEYRVSAINKAGKSEPCAATVPMIAKARFCKLRLFALRRLLNLVWLYFWN